MPNIPLSNTGVFGANTTDPYEFWSAPTSQHASRAPSPRLSRQNSFTPAAAAAAGAIPQQAAFALSNLPQGLNLQRPPTIQRLIPNGGPRSGGDEVTVLGSGFFQGLEVMFGDKKATNTTFWGDTTIVCRAPPMAQMGMVPVVFKHQHHTAPPEMLQVQAIMPTRLVGYNYLDEGPGGGMGGMGAMAGMNGMQGMGMQQMQALAMGFAQQQAQQQGQAGQGMQGRDLSQMSQEELARAFMANQAAMAGYAGVGRGVAGPRRMGQVRQHSSKGGSMANGGAAAGGGGGNVSANGGAGAGAGASAGSVS